MLDAHPECVICSHDVVRVIGKKEVRNRSFGANGFEVKNLADLYKKMPFFAHSSKMFRNDFPGDYWDGFAEYAIDFEIHVEQAKRGSIIHICNFLGGYNENVGMSFLGKRVNPGLPAAYRRVFEYALKNGNVDLSRRKLKTLFARGMLGYAYQSARVGNIVDCRLYTAESIKIKLYSPLQLSVYLISFFPRACRFFANIYNKL